MQNLLIDTYNVQQVLEKVYWKLVWQSSEIYQFPMIWLKDIWLFTKLYFALSIQKCGLESSSLRF